MKFKKEDTTEQLVFKYSAKEFSPLDHRIVYVHPEGEKIPDVFKLRISEKYGDETSTIELLPKVKTLVVTKDNQLVFISNCSKGKLRVPEEKIIDDGREPTMVNNPAVLTSFNAFNTQVASGTIVLSASFLGVSLCVLRRSLYVYMTGKIEKNAHDLFSKEDREIRKQNKCPDVRFFGTKQGNIEHTLDTLRFEKTAMMALLLFGCRQFGPQWLMVHSPKGMLAQRLFNNCHTR